MMHSIVHTASSQAKIHVSCNCLKDYPFISELDSTAKAVSLIYGHEKETAKPDNSIISRIETVMTGLVKSGSLSVKQSSAHEFVQLVNLIRKLDLKRMRPVIDKYFYHASSDEDVKSVYRYEHL